MMVELNAHRQRVSTHFDQVLLTQKKANMHSLAWMGQIDDDSAIETFGELGFRHPKDAISRLNELRASVVTSSSPTPTAPALMPLSSASDRSRQCNQRPGHRLGQRFKLSRKHCVPVAPTLRYCSNTQWRYAVSRIFLRLSWAAEYLNRHPAIA